MYLCIYSLYQRGNVAVVIELNLVSPSLCKCKRRHIYNTTGLGILFSTHSTQFFDQVQMGKIQVQRFADDVRLYPHAGNLCADCVRSVLETLRLAQVPPF